MAANLESFCMIYSMNGMHNRSSEPLRLYCKFLLKDPRLAGVFSFWLCKKSVDIISVGSYLGFL